uniref:Uncharacterized protein n=1 Tax=Solanum tuberosum TaxID=4113 RepID=M1AT09_SOLTU
MKLSQNQENTRPLEKRSRPALTQDSAVGVDSLTWGDDDDGGGGEVEEEQMTSETRFFGGEFRHNCVVGENLEDAEEKKQKWRRWEEGRVAIAMSRFIHSHHASHLLWFS